jgi:DNA-binding NtrC family response regulator
MKRIVVVAQDGAVTDTIRDSFVGHDVRVVSTVEGALTLEGARPCDYLFVEIELIRGPCPAERNHYRAALAPLHQAFPSAHVVVIAAANLTRDTVAAVKAGASSYLVSPIVADQVALLREDLEEADRDRAELDHLRDPFWQDDAELVRTASPVMASVFAKIRQAAPTEATVLLTGETGTGKNVLAQLIYRRSGRARRRFIGVHCGAIAESLLESELFGHERGAFTGAIRRKLGKFEIAHGGTILLDEVGTISSAMQIKLLEVLQHRRFQRVGGEHDVQVDVRVIAATNSNLKELVETGAYRRDLFFRLNVFPIELPPLRERREDLERLATIFLDRANLLHGKGIGALHPLVLQAFHQYDWPGNVRELESLIERAYILESSPVLTPESFPAELFDGVGPLSQLEVAPAETLAAARQRAVDAVERLYLKEQLTRHRGRINATARVAGVTERQLRKIMVKHGLRKEDFK